MKSGISVQRILDVARDFDSFGGASLQLTAWELCVEPTEIAAGWTEATTTGLLEPAATLDGEPPLTGSESLWRLSPSGWSRLGVDPEFDSRRVTTVVRLGVLHRTSDSSLTALARITAYIMGASASAVHIFDGRYQHRIAGHNAPLGHHAAHDTLCRLVVDGGISIICSDATRDERFDHTTFTQGEAPIRFYAATPLRASDDGTVVGTLCAFDPNAIDVTDEQRALLEDLGQLVISQIEFAHAVEVGELPAPQD